MKKRTIILFSIIVFIIIFVLIFKPQNLILKMIYKQDYSQYVYKYAKENDIDPLLVFSIIKVESNFKRNTKSSSNAMGLMQLMEATAIELSNEIDEEIVTTETLYNPDTNIKLGTKYYAYLLKQYNGNTYLALAAYNAGMGNVNKWIEDGIIKDDGSDIENIPFKETNSYVRKIIRDYKIYQELYK